VSPAAVDVVLLRIFKISVTTPKNMCSVIFIVQYSCLPPKCAAERMREYPQRMSVAKKHEVRKRNLKTTEKFEVQTGHCKKQV